jgi:hypothetical protein
MSETVKAVLIVAVAFFAVMGGRYGPFLSRTSPPARASHGGVRAAGKRRVRFGKPAMTRLREGRAWCVVGPGSDETNMQWLAETEDRAAGWRVVRVQIVLEETRDE